MMYRNFAIATLIAAPLIVVVTQNLLPVHKSALAQQQADAVAPPPPPVEPAPAAPMEAQAPQPMAPTPAAPVANPADFSQPMGDAGRPSLSPGTGLPTSGSSPVFTDEPPAN